MEKSKSVGRVVFYRHVFGIRPGQIGSPSRQRLEKDKKKVKRAHSLHQLSHADKESTRQQYPVLHTLTQDTATRHIDRQQHTTELYKDTSYKKKKKKDLH